MTDTATRLAALDADLLAQADRLMRMGKEHLDHAYALGHENSGKPRRELGKAPMTDWAEKVNAQIASHTSKAEKCFRDALAIKDRVLRGGKRGPAPKMTDADRPAQAMDSATRALLERAKAKKDDAERKKADRAATRMVESDTAIGATGYAVESSLGAIADLETEEGSP